MSTLDELARLQDHDRIILELRQQEKDIPERKEQESARLNELQASLDAQKEKRQAAQAEIDRIELERTSGNEKIRKLRQQQMTLKTNREFRAMNQEIAGIELEVSQMEDEELKAVDDLDATSEPISEAEQALAEEQTNVQGYLDELDQMLKEVEAQLAEAEEQRKTLVEGVDRRWLTYYERVLATRGNAVVTLEDGVCDGCHMNLPPAVSVEVKRRQRIVTCDFCGRILS